MRHKTFNDLPKNWEERVYELRGEGRAVATVLKEFGLSWSQHARFLEKYPEYHHAFEFGKVLSESWWFDKLHDNPEGKNNSTSMFVLKCAFNYREYSQEPKSPDDAKAKLDPIDVEDRYKVKEGEAIQ
jgi:hypothetical protein